jgi:hypothetical protein
VFGTELRTCQAEPIRAILGSVWTSRPGHFIEAQAVQTRFRSYGSESPPPPHRIGRNGRPYRTSHADDVKIEIRFERATTGHRCPRRSSGSCECSGRRRRAWRGRLERSTSELRPCHSRRCPRQARRCFQSPGSHSRCLFPQRPSASSREPGRVAVRPSTHMRGHGGGALLRRHESISSGRNAREGNTGSSSPPHFERAHIDIGRLSSLPSQKRGAPSMAGSGMPGAALSPASMHGEPDRKRKSGPWDSGNTGPARYCLGSRSGHRTSLHSREFLVRRCCSNGTAVDSGR